MAAKIDPAALRTEGLSIKTRMEADKKRLKEIEVELVKGGAGKFEECTVVDVSMSYGFPEGEDEARVRELAGENFGKIFETVKSFKPVKSFKEVAGALFKGKTLQAILSRCAKTKSAFVKWNA